jgi:very-short-patch-repair endonuclease
MDIDIITKMYIDEGKSTHEIAETFGTYPNKIRRTLVSNGIELRNRSESRKAALDSGRAEHPTKGKVRTEEVKEKISMSMEKQWANLSKKEKIRRSKLGKEAWKNKTDADKAELHRKAAKALRDTIKNGSNPERLLRDRLTESGRSVELHKKGLIEGTKYEMDLYLPEIATIIEVDGPQHFKPVFGEKGLREYVKHDIIKNGILIKRGFCVIRVKYLCTSYSRAIGRRLWEAVEPVIEQIETKFPPKDKRLIELEIS